MVAGEGSAAAWKDMQPGLDTVGCGKLKDRGPVGIKAHPQRSTTSNSPELSAMEQDNMRPAAALRNAQIKMWRTTQWNAPY
jgi:hypothetical protein